ncbi:MAG TPA: hypothetical protein VKA01_17450, partial [Vicinamibacteria bacterium]|nr:hypothetical protein [Vicinamibacteria bacterium]
MRRLALSIASCSLAAFATAAQRPSGQVQPEPETQGPVFPIDVEMVYLTISVRDETGKLVTDLDTADFAVFE